VAAAPDPGALTLEAPHPRYQASYLAALDELAAEGNGHYFDMVLPAEPGFAGVRYTRETLADPATFAEFCDYMRALAEPGTPRPREWVTGTYLWMVVDGTVVGRVSLRHELTPWLREVGGHIGYAVRPSARRRGYATAALAQMLAVAAGHGIDPALVTCDEDNVGSRRVIEANGGVLEDVRNGKLRFWVRTTT
jgi:predicted acetyltransferase